MVTLHLPPLPPTDPPQVDRILWFGFPGTIAFDVGGHRGESVHFLEEHGFTTIHIFEPDSAGAAEIALRYPNYTLVQSAVGDHVGSLTLCDGGGMLRDPGISGLDWVSGGAQTTFPCTALDVYCTDTGIVPDLVKVDVEGGEVRVLRGAAELVGNNRTAWLFEFHSAENLKVLHQMLGGYCIEVTRHPYYQHGSHLWQSHGWLKAVPHR